MKKSCTDILAQQLLHRREKGLYRQRQLFKNDASFIQFSSNDYLSLTTDAAVRRGFEQAFVHESPGSGGSSVVCGYHPAHRDLEKSFADALQVEDCLLFSSGYAANLCIVSLLKQLHPIVYIDKSVHASVYDGLDLAQVSFKRYLHNDVADLKRKMSQETVGDLNRVIMTESIFSMSGQRAPLSQLSDLAKIYQTPLLVDEAHAFGVVGQEGLGAVVAAQLTATDVPLRMIPFGKALGASGAVVAGQGVWIESLLQMRAAVYSTAMSPAYARGVLNALHILRKADERRERLQQLIHFFQDAVRLSPLKWRQSDTPIQQLQLGCPYRAVALAEALFKQGIVCMPMRQPTVTRDETGLRIILTYQHRAEHIQLLFQSIHEWAKL